jgi:hypothetical protein
MNMFDVSNIPAFMNFLIVPDVLEGTINYTLSHPSVQSLMNENFDAVVVEVFHSEALLGELRNLSLLIVIVCNCTCINDCQFTL